MKKEINLILSVYASCSLIIIVDGFSQLYSLYFILLSIIMYFFFKNVNPLQEKRDKKYCNILSFIFTLIFVIGKLVWEKEIIYNSLIENINIFNFVNIFKIILCSYGIYIIFNKICSVALPYVNKINIYSNQKNDNMYSKKKIFLSCLILIFICYIPYFIRCYPALMSPDSFVQLEAIENGVLTNIHPFVETWFFGGVYLFGKLIFGEGNMALALYTIIQMLLLSSLFSGVVTYLYKKNVNKYICLITLLYFALNPLHANYSITIWKDILFGANFILLLFSLYNLIYKEKSVCNYLLFIISVFILLFFRNNGIYIFIIMVPFLLYFLKNNIKNIFILSFSMIVAYFIITGPVYNYIGIKQTNSTEAYSMPLQQIARLLFLNKIDSETSKELEKFLNIDYVKTNYLPHISDPVKNAVNLDYFDSHKSDFIKIWIKLLIKHPVIYVEAYLSQTLGYWYPDVVYHATTSVNSDSELYNAWDYNIYNIDNCPKILKFLIDKSISKNIPLSIFIWSTGLYCLAVIISIILALYKRQKEILLLYSPFIGLWLTMMIASPVFAELRYIYGIFVCMPIILLIPFIGRKDEKNENITNNTSI